MIKEREWISGDGRNCVFAGKSRHQAQNEEKKISLMILYIISHELCSRECNGCGRLGNQDEQGALKCHVFIHPVCRCSKMRAQWIGCYATNSVGYYKIQLFFLCGIETW